MAEKVKLVGVANGAGTAADVKALSIVGGMVAGADGIDDLDVLRHGGLSRLSGCTPTREEAAWAAERMDSDGHQLAFCRGIPGAGPAGAGRGPGSGHQGGGRDPAASMPRLSAGSWRTNCGPPRRRRRMPGIPTTRAWSSTGGQSPDAGAPPMGIVARTACWVDRWRRFGPPSGNDPKLDDPFGRHVGPYEAAEPSPAWSTRTPASR
ncbi:hypothetical protein ACIA98_14825 [Streptomyces sp. NPDC051366]|uniref:hypothetical protein n=1 Tax=Streptomyces sp. NPDC051366 TaxID=3365652 RepID=UPI00379D434B